MRRGFRSLTALALCLAVLVFPLPGRAPVQRPVADRQTHLLALESFLKAAFSVEYGDQSRDYMLRWHKPIRLSLSGDYTRQDEAFLDAFLADLSRQAAARGFEAFPGIARVEDGQQPNLRVIFCPLEEMTHHLDNYQANNWGYFEYSYNSDYQMDQATVVVASDVTTQRQRNHLLLEEIVGSLGLTNDIDTFRDSIVYQPWTETQRLSELDWLMLGYLYSARVSPGMSAGEALERLLPLTEKEQER